MFHFLPTVWFPSTDLSIPLMFHSVLPLIVRNLFPLLELALSLSARAPLLLQISRFLFFPRRDWPDNFLLSVFFFCTIECALFATNKSPSCDEGKTKRRRLFCRGESSRRRKREAVTNDELTFPPWSRGAFRNPISPLEPRPISREAYLNELLDSVYWFLFVPFSHSNSFFSPPNCYSFFFKTNSVITYRILFRKWTSIFLLQSSDQCQLEETKKFKIKIGRSSFNASDKLLFIIFQFIFLPKIRFRWVNNSWIVDHNFDPVEVERQYISLTVDVLSIEQNFDQF